MKQLHGWASCLCSCICMTLCICTYVRITTLCVCHSPPPLMHWATHGRHCDMNAHSYVAHTANTANWCHIHFPFKTCHMKHLADPTLFADVYRTMYIHTVCETLTHTYICRCNNTWTGHHVKVTHTSSISSISWYTYRIQLLGNVQKCMWQQQMCNTTSSHSGIHSLLLIMHTDSLRYNVTDSNNLLNVVYREGYLCIEDRGHLLSRGGGVESWSQ